MACRGTALVFLLLQGTKMIHRNQGVTTRHPRRCNGTNGNVKEEVEVDARMARNKTTDVRALSHRDMCTGVEETGVKCLYPGNDSTT
jgi:hypothetical protein